MYAYRTDNSNLSTRVNNYMVHCIMYKYRVGSLPTVQEMPASLQEIRGTEYDMNRTGNA
jgi:hypothetical protein